MGKKNQKRIILTVSVSCKVNNHDYEILQYIKCTARNITLWTVDESATVLQLSQLTAVYKKRDKFTG